ncbi:MAG: hypothetical protein SCH71_10250 [Desulfobulbaceae bacterium]|nr:hypothetical protein [Desulfobulbaceae bacterium]
MKILKKLLFADRTKEKNLFFGLHIHKTAGMTLLEQVKSQLRQDQYYINSMYAVNFRQNAKELEERLPDGLDHIRFVFGHGIHEYMLNFFKDRNVRLFTFLREPISRIISWYCYDRKLLKRFNHKILSFNEFYDRCFPMLSLCSMITRAFPTFIDSRQDPLYMQAISVLRKFYFVATLEDFSTKTPLLFDEIGIPFSASAKRNITDYKREMDFDDQIDFDFLQKNNLDDIKLYEAVQNKGHTGELNYFGFDASGFERSINTIFSRTVNPYATLLRNHRGPIKQNYKLEKVYKDALSRYENELRGLLSKRNGNKRELPNLLIKLYALEENEAKKNYYKELLVEINSKSGLGLSKLLVEGS